MSLLKAAGQKLAESAVRRMERAQELGYNNDVFHSTNQDFGEVDISKGDIGFHVGTAEQANNRSKALAKQKSGYPFESDAYLEKEGIPLHREGSNVMPLKLRTSGNVLEMPDVGGWHRGELVARALYENKGGNIPESIQNKAFDISEKIEDYMETDAAYEHAMDVGKWAKSAENRKYLDELNQMIRDEGYSTIKYRNDVENDFLNRAAPKQDIVDRIDALQERKANTVDPQQRATLDIEISQAQEQALQSQADNAYSYIALDPADVRSRNAQFKDPTSKNILAGSAATAVGAGTMTPEQAQAGPLSQGAKRIIDQRFSNPVADSSIRKGVLANAETIPAGIEKRNMDMGGNLNIEDFEGHPYILTQSDRSAAGGTLNSINNQEIDAVNLRGGRDFMFDPASEGQVWASFPSVVDGLHSRAGELKRQTGKNPILMPYAMAPTGIDFATMPLDAMINYARQGMSKTNIKKLDSKIKKVMPNWSGVMNPDSNSQFKNVTGDTRKAVARIIDMQFRDVNGGLSMGEARAATSASDQYLIPDGSLKNAGIIDASKPVLSDSGHPTYIGGLQGEGLGRFTDSMNARAFAEANGRNITGKPNDIRALSMNHSLQQGIIDENLLRFIEKHKKKLATAGALASGGASADQAREQQKFERLEAEEQKLRAMRSSSYGKVSPELAAYRRSQILPSIGTLAQGAVRDTAKGLDYLSPANLTRLLLDPADEGLSRFMAKPISDRIAKGAEVVTQPMLFDEDDPYSKERKEKTMDIGGMLFSPL